MIVINGCPRSGTSLVETLLAKKFNGALMPESHFIPLFPRFLKLWGDVKIEHCRQKLIDAIYDFTEIRTNGTGLNVDKMTPFCLLGTRPQLKAITLKTSSYSEIIHELYEEFRRIHHGSLAIEKTAYYVPVSWDLLAEILPKAKFIHVIRDGRDVAMSWNKAWFGPKNIVLAADLWARHVSMGINWGQKNPDRYLQLHYEEMLSAPETVLGKVGDFIGMTYPRQEYDQSSLQWLKFISKNPHMTKIAGPIASNNIQKWRQGLSLNQLALFEAIAGQALQEAGYQVAVPMDRAANKYWAWACLAFSRGLSCFSLVEWKRRLVKFLPLAIWLTNHLGVSLPKILRKARLVQER